MPILGNNVAGVSSVSLTPLDLFGHWDPAAMGAWGNPVPACTVTRWWVYMQPPNIPEPDPTVQLALYDASGGLPANYTVVITSPTFVVTAGGLPAWKMVADSQALAAGTYGLAILSNSGGTFTGSVFWTLKLAGAQMKGFIVPGVFPSPLGIANLGTDDWSMYIEYGPPAPVEAFTPTAAFHCQPKCGEG